jgi:trans-2,3-dihydro-3-hydroxyanthranilate isomerase
MPVARPLHIVDVFAETKYAGNQLAVVGDAGALGPGEMQRIAREMNFAETTFLVSGERRDGAFDVRIFTPRAEVPFAGHPTLGTAWVIRNLVLDKPRDEVRLNLGVGQIPVRFVDPGGERDVVWMQQQPARFGDVVDPAQAAAVLGLELRDLDDRFPSQQVSTGLPFLIVPVRSLPAVQRARLDRARADELYRARGSDTVYFFCPQTLDGANQIHARMFAERFGVPEDPATGSAAGCLGCYLVRHRCFGSDTVDIRIEQGHQIDRPSLLRVRARERGDAIEAAVGGKVALVARGELV